MPISHADHDHPNTPAARAACRKAMGSIIKGTTHETVENVEGDRKPIKMTMVPRKRGDGGVVKGMKAAGPERFLRTSADIPVDCPQPLHYAITRAWANGWDVVEGYKLNDMENRILIAGTIAQVSIVWNAAGFSAIFIRRLDSSVTHRADSAQAAMGLASGDDDWPWKN